MIDNTEILRPLLKFPFDTSFYFLQIIKRRKENPELKKPQTIIKNYYIHSTEEFDELYESVVTRCVDNNARAYLRLNIRDLKKVALATNRKIAEYLFAGDYKSVQNAYDKATGEFHADPDKKWIVDFDGEEAQPVYYTPVLNEIVRLNPDAAVAMIPTKNGLHFISRPFNLQEFNKTFPNIKLSDKIHKDSPTIWISP